MSKRTSSKNASKIEHSEDLNHLVKDKRAGKRANKQKGNRRNRHYVNLMMRHLKEEHDESN